MSYSHCHPPPSNVALPSCAQELHWCTMPCLRRQSVSGTLANQAHSRSRHWEATTARYGRAHQRPSTNVECTSPLLPSRYTRGRELVYSVCYSQTHDWWPSLPLLIPSRWRQSASASFSLANQAQRARSTNRGGCVRRKYLPVWEAHLPMFATRSIARKPP